MPPAATGAGPFIEPPLARNPLIVGNSLLVSKLQTRWPSSVDRALTAPSFEGENSTPGISVTAENSAPEQDRLSLPHTGGSGGAYQARLPDARSTACRPPGAGL